MNKAEITPEALLADGWEKNEGNPMSPFSKVLTEKTEDLGAMKMVISRYYNSGYLPAIVLPEGGLLWLTCKDMEHLRAVETSIAGYEPVW